MRTARLLAARALTALLLAGGLPSLGPRALDAQAPTRPRSAVLDGVPGSEFGAVPQVTFRADPSLTYRYAWAVSAAADSAGQVTPGFLAPARVLNALRRAGVPGDRIHLALVVRGPAAAGLLTNAAHRALTGQDNPNLPVLDALAAAGVRIIVCGQTVIGRPLPRDGFPPYVLVSEAATMAHAILHAQGYGFNPF